MASIRPEDYLGHVYQVRFYDDQRDLPRTTSSVPKSE
jgi:hypothetical protein